MEATVESGIVLLLEVGLQEEQLERQLLLARELQAQQALTGHFSRTLVKVEAAEQAVLVSMDPEVLLVMRPLPEDVAHIILEIRRCMVQEILPIMTQIADRQMLFRGAQAELRLHLSTDSPLSMDNPRERDLLVTQEL